MSTMLRWLLSLWAALQLGRLIAIPLIQSVAAGTDPAAWMLPALIDVVVAAGVPFALWAIWRGRRYGSWLYLILWLALSVFDHASAVTAFRMVGVPSIFANLGDPGLVVPALQTVVDALAIWMLCRRPMRQAFALEA